MKYCTYINKPIHKQVRVLLSNTQDHEYKYKQIIKQMRVLKPKKRKYK